jgi:hypothetical protein
MESRGGQRRESMVCGGEIHDEIISKMKQV